MKFLKCLQLSVWCSCQINGQIGDCRPNTVKRAKKKTELGIGTLYVNFIGGPLRSRVNTPRVSHSLSHMFPLKQLKLIVKGSLICLDHFRLESNMDASASKIKHIRQRRPFW